MTYNLRQNVKGIRDNTRQTHPPQSDIVIREDVEVGRGWRGWRGYNLEKNYISISDTFVEDRKVTQMDRCFVGALK